MSPEGTKARTPAPAGRSVVAVPLMTYPYDTSVNWLGKLEPSGSNWLTLVTPSGLTSARYSPPALRLKLVCNGCPGTRRFLPEHQTSRKECGARFVAGNCHLIR